MLFHVAKISVLVLAILVCAGGVMGFLKAQSKASLIAGVVSGGLLITAYSVANRNLSQGLVFAAVLCALLCVVFGMRLKKTGKFMPSGLMLALSGIELVFLGVVVATQH